MFITQPIHHPQQKGAEDDKLVPGPSTRTTSTGRTKDLLKDWHEKAPVNQFLRDFQVVELLRDFSLLPSFEKVTFLHLNAPDLHQRGNDLLCMASESRKRMKCQFLGADLKKNMGKQIKRGALNQFPCFPAFLSVALAVITLPFRNLICMSESRSSHLELVRS